MAAWVTFEELFNEAGLDDQGGLEDLDPNDEQRLRRDFNAAVAFVERIHRGRYNFSGEPTSTLKLPTEDLKLGTLMLARRWDSRRRSVNGIVSMGEMGASRVTSYDADIDRLLRIGRHARPRVG